MKKTPITKQLLSYRWYNIERYDAVIRDFQTRYCGDDKFDCYDTLVSIFRDYLINSHSKAKTDLPDLYGYDIEKYCASLLNEIAFNNGIEPKFPSQLSIYNVDKSFQECCDDLGIINNEVAKEASKALFQRLVLNQRPSLLGVRADNRIINQVLTWYHHNEITGQDINFTDRKSKSRSKLALHINQIVTADGASNITLGDGKFTLSRWGKSDVILDQNAFIFLFDKNGNCGQKVAVKV